jgi:hypothetical protein
MEFLEGQKTFTLILIVASTLLGTIHSNSEAYRTRGRVMFEFIRYSNPLDQTESGGPCELLNGICDPYFQICVSPAEDDECAFIQYTSKIFTDTREISGERRGPLQNQLLKLFTDPLPNDYYVMITAKDHSSGFFSTQEVIRKFQMKIRSIPTFNYTDPTGENATIIEMLPTSPNPYLKIRLWIKLWSICELNFYGNMCEILCQKSDQYTCNVNGTKICSQGWSGRECLDRNYCIDEEKICAANAFCINKPHQAECFCNGKVGPECYANFNFCANNPCQNGGQCSLTPRYYSCECRNGFHGNHCEIQESPCDSQPCQNGAECYSHASGNYYCNCLSGFHGKQCENITTSTLLTSKDPYTWSRSTSLSTNFNESVVAFGHAVTETLNIAAFPLMVVIIASITAMLIAAVIGVTICSFRRKKQHIKEIHEAGVYDYEEPMMTANSNGPRLGMFKDRSDVPPGGFLSPSEQEQYILFSMQPVTYVRPPANENLYEECEPVLYPAFSPQRSNMSNTSGVSGFERSIYEPPNFEDRPSRSSGLPSIP